MSSSIRTLFTEQKVARAGSPSMLASIAAHFLTIGLLFVLVKVGRPHVVNVPPQELSVVRVLTYSAPREIPGARASSAHHQGHNAHALKAPGGAPRPKRRVLPHHPKIKTGKETILQAHANKVAPPKHAVIPTVLLTAAHPKITQNIYTPKPHPNPAAPTPRMLTLPNAETHVADIMLSSTAFTTPHLVLPPSTTVPYKLNHPKLNAQIVETTSPSKHAPTPTRLLALSDLEMVVGSIVIPQSKNVIQDTKTKGPAAPGVEDLTPGNGAGMKNGLSILRAALADSGTKGQPNIKLASSNDTNSKPGNLASATAHNGSSQGNKGLSPDMGTLNAQADPENGTGHKISFTHLSKSKAGQFGAVLLGDSPEQAFPETADLWKGRNAYTVYINVGTSTSWILQFSLPKTAPPADLQGKLNAPYPFDMLRPNFPPSELNADDLLVHGFIDSKGRLKNLTIEFPPDFALAKQVLKALYKWEFRPATLNGTPTSVEVLLIIPNTPS